jgi:hypothetical protein
MIRISEENYGIGQQTSVDEISQFSVKSISEGSKTEQSILPTAYFWKRMFD